MSGKIGFTLWFVFSFLLALAQSPLKNTISISFDKEPLNEALLKLSTVSFSQLSFNPDILPTREITSAYQEQTLKYILDDLLGDDFQYKIRGSYVIIQEHTSHDTKSIVEISGEITDASTGEKLPDVTIYEVNRLTATLSSFTGSYNLTSKTFGKRAIFAISKENYKDTIIMVDKSEKGFFNLSLKPLLKKKENDETEREKKNIFKFLVNAKTKKHTENVDMNETRLIQLSLVPGIGTNGFLGGKVTNKISINMVGGYEYGLIGMELGGAFNLTRQEAIGVQVGGATNVSGGRMLGVQVAGAVNSTWENAEGTQISGAVNIANGRMEGVQLSGAYNFAKDAVGAQISGAVNSATTHKGVQMAGAINVTTGLTTGFQAAGAINYSRHFNGLQMSGVYNHANGTLKGLQASGAINYASKLSGVQIGVINIASEVENGAMIGVINLTKNGILAFEPDHNDVTDYNFSFRSGTKAFYTILSSGVTRDLDLWSFGAGVGSQIGLGKKMYTGLELSSHQLLVSGPGFSFGSNRSNDHRFNLSLGYSFTKRISINAGPVLHFMHYHVDKVDASILELGKNPLFEKTQNGETTKWWIGYRIAFRL